jgi:hypothetical protein
MEDRPIAFRFLKVNYKMETQLDGEEPFITMEATA